MLKTAHAQDISFESSEIETCLSALKKLVDERDRDENNALLATLLKFDFFHKMPYKYAEIREQEINLFMEKCIKYMTIISFNPQEILIERGKKIEYLYFVMRGKVGLYIQKTPQEIQNELENWRKTQYSTIQEENLAQDLHRKPENIRKVTLGTFKKLNTHQLGSLAKENMGKFLLRDNIYKIKQVGEVLSGCRIFEGSVTTPQVSEYTVLAKETSDLVAISVPDYQKAVQDVRNVYKNRYKLLRKSFLTADEVPLNKIAMYFTEHKYSCNEPILNEGDKSDCLYCVASGEIHLLQSRKRRDTVARGASYLYGYTNLVDTILQGDFFGDEWFYEEKERRYTAIAKLEGTVVLSVDSAVNF